MEGEILMSCLKGKTENIGFRLRALIWVFLGTITLVLWMGAPHAVYAVPLSNTSLTGTEFNDAALGFLGSSINSLNMSFVFGGDVELLSQVFSGKAGSPAAGFNVYIYQVIHKSGSSLSPITQFNFDWVVGAPPKLDFSGIGKGMVDSFYVAGGPAVALTGFTAGTEDPNISEFFPVPESVRFEFALGVDPIAAGETSFILGMFSPNPPGLLPANAVDGSTSSAGTAYSPVPEPSTLWLLAIGFAGIVIYTGFRERLKCEGNSLRTHG